MKPPIEADEADHADDDDSGGDNDEGFFETFDRIPSSVSFDLCACSSSSDAEDDARTSFASAVGDPAEFRRIFSTAADVHTFSDDDEDDDYDVWMSKPLSIEDRRRRLLQAMGLSTSTRNGYAAASRRIAVAVAPTPPAPQPPAAAAATAAAIPAPLPPRNSPAPRPNLTRSRSVPGLQAAPRAGGPRRASSAPPPGKVEMGRRELSRRATRRRSGAGEDGDPVACYTIKNLDTGKEFVINLENGAWNSRLSDLQTGTQITMDEFEKSMGHSPIIKELLRRERVAKRRAASAPSANNSNVKSAGGGKKKGAGWLKNIRFVANSVTGLVTEKDGSAVAPVAVDRVTSRNASATTGSSAADWMKVHRRGKPYKELTGLYMSQEIQAHEGSIWCIRFSADATYMASAGEDRVIHVWQVVECDTTVPSSSSTAKPDSININATDAAAAANGGGSTCACTSPERSTTPRLEVKPSSKMKRGKTMSSRRKGASSTPDHVVVPETIFSLSEKPVCSFQGHLDDVLDLSWSKSQLLLSSSMDKTVRLWDMETQACLNLFAHNDYVTCIQFNPVDDRYFISGSLDAKVRIWSIPDRQVIDWNDLHEMVTAACYTPDGQGALVGSHKGTCRFYSMTDCKLQQKFQIDIHNKKKKSHAKKITGFQFASGNSSEVLITSADSQIRIYDGVDLIHKFRGFRNTSSQISASFTPDGSYIVCASEDSHVYVWKREEHRGSSGKRNYVSTRSHENFSCKDVSVVVPWPGSIRYERPSACPSSRFCPSPMQSPNHHTSSASIMSSPDDPFCSSRSHCPPLPKKSTHDRPLSCTEEELRNPSRSGSSLSNTSSSWLWSGPLSSISSGFNMSSSRWGGSHRNATRVVTAWGLVVVAAGLGGEIRVYQNFGLPIRLSKQANLH